MSTKDARLQLHYWEGGNFGDAMNLWLWPKVAGDLIDAERPYRHQGARPLLIGIGSLLTPRLFPHSSPGAKAVLGSGAGAADNVFLEHGSRVYGVRGPNTAEALGLPASSVIGDPATLIASLALAPQPKRHFFAFMPHHASLGSADWPGICRQLGIQFLDPRAPFEQVLSELRAAHCVIAEAMHAAIVADALRIPWVPVRFHRHINAFKWQDWCQSLGLDYKPRPPATSPARALIRRRVPPVLSRSVRGWNNVLGYLSLKTLVRNPAPWLSDPGPLALVTQQQQKALQALREDVRAGAIAGAGSPEKAGAG